MKAAELGNPGAQQSLGSALMLGEGIEQDMVAALKWFIVSARAGNKEASNYANKVGRFLSRDMQREARMMAIDWKKAHDEKFPPKIARPCAANEPVPSSRHCLHGQSPGRRYPYRLHQAPRQ